MWQVLRAFDAALCERDWLRARTAARRLSPYQQLEVIDAMLAAHARLGLTMYKACLH